MEQVENLEQNFKESIIKEDENENEMPYKLDNDKKELLDSISPIFNDTQLNKDELINKYNINSPSINIKNEEFFDYKAKKIKLFNLYNQLLEFKQKLIKKEKELNMKEKNLLEFENILKSNEIILKNNIEQFDIYIKTKINELKNQFNQIEQIQINKENYLKQKEEEIFNYKRQSYNILNSNNNKCINCNCDLCNEDEIITPFIDNYIAQNEYNEINNDNINNNDNEVHFQKINNYGRNGFYCKGCGCKNYIKKIHHQKNKSENSNYVKVDTKFNHFRNNFNDYNNNNKRIYHRRNINKTHENTNDYNRYNYSSNCPGCEYCNL